MNKKKAAAIGKTGEDQIAEVLAAIPDERLMRNLYIPGRGGHTIEIDALLITQKGLYVIEIKNYTGQITGSVRLNEWTQTYRIKGSRSPIRNKFYNPIKQNRSHIEALSRYLKLPESKKPHSIIVFTHRAELKKVPPSTSEFTILHGTGTLRAFLLRNLKLRGGSFTPQELNAIIKDLKETPKPTSKLKRAHVANAKAAERKRLQEKERRRRSRKKGSRRKSAAASRKRMRSVGKKALLLLLFAWLL